MYKELSLEECIERICAVERPLVLMHVRPDGDTVGSAAGLMEIFRMLGREVKYACTDKIPERLRFLLSDYTMAEPCEYRDLTPVSIDIPSPMQLGPIADSLPQIDFMIDHHEVAVPFADIYTIRGMSSAGEVLYVIAEKMCEMGLISMTERLAYPIFAAISSDTGCFCYSNTSAMTHIRTAELMRCGIDAADINHRLFHSKPREQLLAEGMVLSRLLSAAEGRVAYSYISRSERDKAGIAFEHFETAIEMVRSVKGAEIAFVVKETDRGEYKGSIRSTGADVIRVATLFSGGGHTRAAGCTLYADSIEAAADMLLHKILELYF